MGMITDTLVSELREHTGLSTDELSNADSILLLNRSYWEVLDKFPFREKEQTATFTTAQGQRNYTVPTLFEALRQLSITNPDNNELIPLKRSTIYVHEGERDLDADAEGFPEKYVREKNLIRLLPVPDQTYTITIKYWTILDDLDNNTGTTVDLTVPQIWHEIILFGGIWRSFLRLRDFSAANQYKMQQLALINSAVPVEAKEEFDSHTAHVEVLGRDYP